MKSSFSAKTPIPNDGLLKSMLGNSFNAWQALVSFTHKLAPHAKSGWHWAGDKYGWSYRISDTKRVLVYMLPQDKFFRVSFVFGKKATDTILESTVSEQIKTELKTAKVYAEGRPIRIEVRDASVVKDLEKLVSAKIAH